MDLQPSNIQYSLCVLDKNFRLLGIWREAPEKIGYFTFAGRFCTIFGSISSSQPVGSHWEDSLSIWLCFQAHNQTWAHRQFPSSQPSVSTTFGFAITELTACCEHFIRVRSWAHRLVWGLHLACYRVHIMLWAIPHSLVWGLHLSLLPSSHHAVSTSSQPGVRTISQSVTELTPCCEHFFTAWCEDDISICYRVHIMLWALPHSWCEDYISVCYRAYIVLWAVS